MMATLKSEMKWKSLSHVRLSVIAWTIHPWNSPGQNTGVSSRSFLQGIFPTQRLNPGLLYCRGILFSSWDTREAHFKKCCISNTLPYKMPIIRNHQIRSDQSLSRARLFATPWIMCRAAQLASIRQMRRQVSRGSGADYEADEQAGVSSSAGEYQADEQAGVAGLSWRLSSR